MSNPSEFFQLLQQPPKGKNYKLVVDIYDPKLQIGVTSKKENIRYNLSVLEPIMENVEFNELVQLDEGIIEIFNVGDFVNLLFKSHSGERSIMCVHHYKTKIEMNNFISAFVSEKMALVVLKKWLSCINSIISVQAQHKNVKLVQYGPNVGSWSIDWD